MYPVGDGSRPLDDKPSVTDSTTWDNTSRDQAGNIGDIGYYDGTSFGDYSGSYHTGIDLNGDEGGSSDCDDPVYAASDGEVVESVLNTHGWGNLIRIKHQVSSVGDVYTLYVPLSVR